MFFGLCSLGPIMIVYPEGSFYSMVKVEDIPEIVEEHLLKGRIVTRLLYHETVEKDTIKSLNHTPCLLYTSRERWWESPRRPCMAWERMP